MGASQKIDAGINEIQRIERLLTTFSDDSETNQVNQNAGISPVKVSRETFNLIESSLRISQITQGAFDITYGSIDKRLWNFDQHMTSLPDKETAKKMVRLINYRMSILDRGKMYGFFERKRNADRFWRDRKRICRRTGQTSDEGSKALKAVL